MSSRKGSTLLSLSFVSTLGVATLAILTALVLQNDPQQEHSQPTSTQAVAATKVAASSPPFLYIENVFPAPKTAVTLPELPLLPTLSEEPQTTDLFDWDGSSPITLQLMFELGNRSSKTIEGIDVLVNDKAITEFKVSKAKRELPNGDFKSVPSVFADQVNPASKLLLEFVVPCRLPELCKVHLKIRVRVRLFGEPAIEECKFVTLLNNFLLMQQGVPLVAIRNSVVACVIRPPKVTRLRFPIKTIFTNVDGTPVRFRITPIRNLTLETMILEEPGRPALVVPIRGEVDIIVATPGTTHVSVIGMGNEGIAVARMEFQDLTRPEDRVPIEIVALQLVSTEPVFRVPNFFLPPDGGGEPIRIEKR